MSEDTSVTERPPLASRRAGRGDPRLVLVHGFTQTSRCWAPVDDALATDHEVVAVDLPGHGGSCEVAADLWRTADLLARTAGAGVWIGYSLGGRLALHVALAHPEVVQGLVLIGATAGIAEAEDRAARRASDEALAAELERDGLSGFLDRWLAQPLFAGLSPDRAHRPERERNDPAGLAASLRMAGTGTQTPLWDRLGEITCPVLAVTGAEDEKFSALAVRLCASVRGPAEHVVLPGAGHTAHLEQPERFVAIVQAFLDRFFASGRPGQAP